MNLLAVVLEAARSLGANKLRTALTMLGMVIGVAAVVLMLAVGSGAQNQVNRAVSSMGSNLLVILSGSTSTGTLRMGSGNAPTLTTGDAEAIARLPNVQAVAPTFPGGAQVAYGINNWGTQVLGVTPEYTAVRDWPVESGDAFSETDIRSSTRVALLGATVVEKLFDTEDPVGKTIRIRGQPFTVLGVLRKKGQSLDGRDQDDSVLVPITTAQSKLFGNRFPGTVRFMFVQAVSQEATSAAENDITLLLRQRHRIQPDADDDFTVRNLTQVAEAASQTARILSLMLGAIGSISLVVGGIGIMNIMLVSVTERTREIGVRMAIGAKGGDIRAQFLVEAVVLAVCGGTVGIGLGMGIQNGVAQLAGWPVAVSSQAIALAFVFSALVGIAFGFYPALKASRLDPIEALRYE